MRYANAVVRDPRQRVMTSCRSTGFAYGLAFGFGCGWLPAPGTMGSLWGLPLALITASIPFYLGLIGTALGVWIGWWACAKAYVFCRSTDHKAIVVDEVVGMWLALLFLPVHVGVYATAFVLFRCLDIFKPWPISWCEHGFSRHHGVMMDDVAAGLVTNAVMSIYLYAGVAQMLHAA